MYSIGALLCVLVVTLLALPSPSSLSSAPLRFFVSLPSADLQSHCTFRYPLFNLPPQRRHLTVNISWTSLSSSSSPTPPPLHHFAIKSLLSMCAHCYGHRGTGICSSHRRSYVSSSHCQPCLHLLGSCNLANIDKRTSRCVPRTCLRGCFDFSYKRHYGARLVNPWRRVRTSGHRQGEQRTPP